MIALTPPFTSNFKALPITLFEGLYVIIPSETLQQTFMQPRVTQVVDAQQLKPKVCRSFTQAARSRVQRRDMILASYALPNLPYEREPTEPPDQAVLRTQARSRALKPGARPLDLK